MRKKGGRKGAKRSQYTIIASDNYTGDKFITSVAR